MQIIHFIASLLFTFGSAALNIWFLSTVLLDHRDESPLDLDDFDYFHTVEVFMCILELSVVYGSLLISLCIIPMMICNRNDPYPRTGHNLMHLLQCLDTVCCLGFEYEDSACCRSELCT